MMKQAKAQAPDKVTSPIKLAPAIAPKKVDHI